MHNNTYNATYMGRAVLSVSRRSCTILRGRNECRYDGDVLVDVLRSFSVVITVEGRKKGVYRVQGNSGISNKPLV